MGGESFAAIGVGVRELCWCEGGIPRVAKNREKSEKKTSSTFFSFDRHRRHFPETLRDVAVRAPSGHRLRSCQVLGPEVKNAR